MIFTWSILLNQLIVVLLWIRLQWHIFGKTLAKCCLSFRMWLLSWRTTSFTECKWLWLMTFHALFSLLSHVNEPNFYLQDVPPVIQTPHYYLISIQRGNVSLIAACKQETQPLFVIEFLHRIVDTFQDYFAECSESIIKENYVVVYELLDEMLDNGFPLATESNILKELIKPPNILRTLANTVTGKSKYAFVQVFVFCECFIWKCDFVYLFSILFSLVSAVHCLQVNWVRFHGDGAASNTRIMKRILMLLKKSMRVCIDIFYILYSKTCSRLIKLIVDMLN